MRWRNAVVTGWMLAATALAGAGTVWIEGESAQKSTFNNHGWYGNVRKEMLSQNAWLGHYSTDQPAEATWQFSVDEGGTYALWMRVNPDRAPL